MIVVRRAQVVAVILFFAAVAGSQAMGDSAFALLAPAGALLLARGALMLRDPSFLAELALREQTRSGWRLGSTIETRYGAWLLMIIGLGWVSAAFYIPLTA